MASTQKSRPRCVRRVCCGASAPFACAPRAPEPLGSAGAYPSVAARLFRLWWCTLESHLHPLLLLLFKALVRQHCAQPVRAGRLRLPGCVVLVLSLT